ncbi:MULTISPECIES: FAD-binding protein [Rhodococcus]|nr:MULTISPECIES: FAD-binding protein [Rhodococcus]MDV7243292.1 FAD-binding protein [Rhodococcus oxybenzonivorans]MDV7276720.1 FAD-binding protein [Rhodococcus oxybenzonivorans]MDV7334449.1 FAD-binding protein [Rhodococcus oxybenzonivorans]MDV7344603.1 FAD-binding protein [Rhodococcus oxybenzonivorans]MDV8030472.1 FAD-binding protein [Rhodococcus sp. IEGM 27]
MSAGSQTFDTTVDFLVVGSGGGGMAAAITAAHRGLDTLVIDKGATFGGSTAISGGGIWIPNAPTLREKGVVDSRESIRRYLDIITEGRVSADRLDAFVDKGPELMELLDRSPHMKLYWVKGYSDYHPEYDGGRPLGRTIECKPFDTRALQDDERYQRPNSMKGPLGLWVTSKDYHDLAMVKRTWKGRKASLVAAWRVASNVIRRRHMATGGRALVARMRMVLKDAGVPLWLQTSMTELIVDDSGVVLGVVAKRDGNTVRIGAKRGVLLATGGFEHNEDMRAEYLPKHGVANISAGAKENTGDGILAGQKLGAAVDLMDDAWWMPSVMHPMGAVIPLVSERCIPPSVIVNSRGERFTNESSPYVNFVHDQLDGGHVPAWFVMDSKAKSRYPFAQVLPGVPFPQGFYDSGVVHKADTLRDLADQIGVKADTLVATVDRFNGFARTGRDEDFGRGDSAYDRYYGDPTMKNPCLDEITQGPFYAIRCEAGDLGTKGGLVTDADARVLREDGSVIDGLYATGNTSASVMGNEYAGAGATIGPAMVFGYIAAQHAAQAGGLRRENRSHAGEVA